MCQRKYTINLVTKVTELLNFIVNLVIEHRRVIKNVWLEFIARRNICESYDSAFRRNV